MYPSIMWKWGRSGQPAETLGEALATASGTDLWIGTSPTAFSSVLDEPAVFQRVMLYCMEVALPVWEESIKLVPAMRGVVDTKRAWLAGRPIDPEQAFALWAEAEKSVNQDWAQYRAAWAAGWVIVNGGSCDNEMVVHRLTFTLDEYSRMHQAAGSDLARVARELDRFTTGEVLPLLKELADYSELVAQAVRQLYP